MIKIVLIGAWVCIISLGAVYAAVTLAGGSADSAAAKQEIPPAYVAGEVLSKVSVMIDQEMAAKTHIPMAPYITDELYTLLVGDKMIDLPKAGHLDVEGLREKIKTDLNAKAKEELVTSVIFEQLDYISKADATGKPSQRAATKKIIPPEPAPAGAATGKKGAPAPSH
jgi:hypothetical protein